MPSLKSISIRGKTVEVDYVSFPIHPMFDIKLKNDKGELVEGIVTIYDCIGNTLKMMFYKNIGFDVYIPLGGSHHVTDAESDSRIVDVEISDIVDLRFREKRVSTRW